MADVQVPIKMNGARQSSSQSKGTNICIFAGPVELVNHHTYMHAEYDNPVSRASVDNNDVESESRLQANSSNYDSYFFKVRSLSLYNLMDTCPTSCVLPFVAERSDNVARLVTRNITISKPKQSSHLVAGSFRGLSGIRRRLSEPAKRGLISNRRVVFMKQ